MCKTRFVSVFTLVIVMTTIRALEFPLASLILKAGTTPMTLRNNEEDDEDGDPVENAKITIGFEIESKDQDQKTVKLNLTGFPNQSVFMGGIDMTSSYQTLAEDEYEVKYLVFKCKNGNQGEMEGKIAGNGITNPPELLAVYTDVPENLKTACEELGQKIERNRRLILV